MLNLCNFHNLLICTFPADIELEHCLVIQLIYRPEEKKEVEKIDSNVLVLLIF